MKTQRDLQISSTVIADLLDAIPQWDEGQITISEWIERAMGNEKTFPEYAELIISLLKTLDAISILELGGMQGLKIKSRSELSSYFIKSLSIYFREDKKIFSNWERSGVTEGPYSFNDLLLGPQFLYAMELQRISKNEHAPVIRKTIVVKAIIKARLRGLKEPVYLVQFDEKTRKYQIVGGHTRKTDDNPENALKRELEEELHKGNSIDRLKYELRFLNKITKNEISLTCGAYTEYEIYYFQPLSMGDQLILGPNDRWITLNELLEGKTKNGIGINETAIKIINQNLPGGLTGLNFSLDQIQKYSLLKLAKDHPWESIGIILGLIGILLSIIFFLASQ